LRSDRTRRCFSTTKWTFLSKRGREINAMIEELQNYEIHVSEMGADQFGAFKTGSHDDLVTALALEIRH